MQKESRDKHCIFAVFNSAGRCIADCYYNRNNNFKKDCTGRTDVHHSEVGHEVKLNGRKIV